jgi:hypothetical protein
LAVSAILFTADPAAAQRVAQRPRPTSRYTRIHPNQAVVGGDWDFFLAGSQLNFRRGSANREIPVSHAALGRDESRRG